MSKKERLGYFPPPPVPTPQQLENSIRALIPFNPGDNPADRRIKRYRAEIPEAKKREDKWREAVERIKKI